MGFLGQKYAETIPWAKVEFFYEFCEKWSKIGLTHQREAPKLTLA